jgi:hypothetical protein
MRAVMCGVLFVVAACGPPNPCSGHQFDRQRRYSLPYAGHWVVARGDTLTFPDAPGMSDRFRLRDIVLDTTTVIVGRECLFRGHIIFCAPRADTIAAAWFGQPGVALAWAGRDSLSGAILLDSKLGVQARPGMTARFVAGRAQQLSSAP